LERRLFEARRHPNSKKGMMTGQGNLVEAKAIWHTPGRTIAAIQRIVFHFSSCFFSDQVIAIALKNFYPIDTVLNWGNGRIVPLFPAFTSR
jgi:hypothetical protein